MNRSTFPHHSVIVVGGGQAGLAMSYHLKRVGLDHVVLEKNSIAHSWKTQRWDAFCLVTPNWQCRLPGYPYQGSDPKGFMLRDEVVAYIEGYARHINAPVREGIAVTRLTRDTSGCFALETSSGTMTAKQVVLAVSGYHVPNIPRVAEKLAPDIIQIHSSTYRNPQQMPDGEILVVGSGQSGCQIAEDLHLGGRKVHLAVGSAPRCPRVYRGRDAVEWLDDLGQYDLPVEQHSLKEKVRKNANHYVTGRDGGRDIDLRRLALEGMQLHGRVTDIAGHVITFGDDLAANLDNADCVYNGICGLIDDHIARNRIDAPPQQHYTPVWQPKKVATKLDLAAVGIQSIVWTTGFRSDWSWVDLPLFDGAGYPTHTRGVTLVKGIYVLGMPWLHTWGSGRFVGVGCDAEFIARKIETAFVAKGDIGPAQQTSLSHHAA